MTDSIDEIMLPEKPSRLAKRAMMMFGWSAFCYLLVIIAGGVLIASRLNVVVIMGVMVLLPFLAAFFSVYGFTLSVRSFLSREAGGLKYFAIIGNGLFTLIFGLITFANVLDLSREFL